MNEEARRDEKKDIFTLGMQAGQQEDVASFSHDPFLKKKLKVKKNTLFFFLTLVFVIARALYISSHVKIAINHFEGAAWFQKESARVNWCSVVQDSDTKPGLTSVVERQMQWCAC